MVMLTRSSYRRACESFDSSDKSQGNMIAPPWCSLAKVPERRKPRRTEVLERRSASPLRSDICEYLLADKRKLVKRKHSSRASCKPTPGDRGCGKTVIVFALLSIVAGITTTLLMADSIPETAIISKVMQRTNLKSIFGFDHTSVDAECCSRMKYLIAELLRAEQALKNTHRLRRTMLLTSRTASKTDPTIDGAYIEGATVTRGKDTKEWGSRVALWGVVPLWRAAPPPDTVLALRKPVPSDCWPFSGSFGELNFDLPRSVRIRCMSLEHVYPDAATSAPKHFILFGILPNGTWIKAVSGEYKHFGPAKQYYSLQYRDTPLQQLVFRVLTNHGNPHYTCVYRVHLYENKNVEYSGHL
ncbi:SUN domain-containing protein 3-like [Phthorimaea operculella]|nr:SUN domain-containing protein 3-like [Phthorimaea operculella]